MKVKVTKMYQSEDRSLTTVTLATPIGEFRGMAKFNPEKDPLTPSFMLGGRIAEDRAYIAFYDELIKRKTYEIKGIKRVLNSSYPNKPGWTHLIKIFISVIHERDELIDKRDRYTQDIADALEGRKLFVRSRTDDKETKKKKLEELGSAIKALGQNKSKDK